MQDDRIELGLHPVGASNGSVGSPTRNLVVGINGIGFNTNSPLYPAHLVSTAAGYGYIHENAGVRVGTFINAAGGWLGTQSNDDLRLFTNDNSGNLIIQASTGHVGIGTNTPPEPLSVLGQIGWGTPNTGTNRLQSDQGGSIDLGGNNFTANPVPGGAPYIDFHFGNGLVEDYNMRIINNGNNILSITDNTMASRLTINNGNVGIGVVSPVSILDINGDVRLAQGSAPGVTTDKLYNVGGSLFWNGTNISSGGSGWGLTGNAGINPATNFIGTTDAQDFRIRTNNLERLTVTSLGNVGLGTTNPLSRLQLGSRFSFFSDPVDPQEIITRNIYNDGTNFRYILAGGATALTMADNKMGMFIFPVGAANGVASSPAGRLNFTTTGLVINGDSPNDVLDVRGPVYINAYAVPPGTVTDRLYNVGGNLFWNGTNISAGGSGWGLTGNAGTNPATQFIGTTDLQDFRIRTNNVERVSVGQNGSFIINGSVYNTQFNVGASQHIDIQSGGGLGNVSLNSSAVGNVLLAAGGGNVGIGTNSPNAKLSVGLLGGTAASTSFSTNAGVLGTGSLNELPLASIGFNSGNQSSLSVRAIRQAAGTDWTTTAILLGMDVDNTVRAGGAMLSISNNGNIGIGTGAPTENLTVQGGVNIDNGSLNNGTVANSLRFGFGASGEAIAGKRTPGGNQFGLDFYTGSAARMSITSTGNVGIGTTSPTSNLHVVGTTPSFRLQGTGSNLLFSANLGDETELIYNSGTGSTGLTFRNGFSADVMKLTGNRQVGIGTTAPQGRLHVANADYSLSPLHLSGSNGTAGTTIRFTHPDPGARTYNIVGSTGSLANMGAGYFGIYDDNAIAYRFTISPAGNIGIGVDAGLSRLHVEDAITAAGQYVIRGINTFTGSADGVGVYGQSTSGPANWGIGVVGRGNYIGVEALAGAGALAAFRAQGFGADAGHFLGNVQISTGYMELLSIAAPGTTTDRLYNVGGNLFWNGTNISSGSSGWGLTGNTLTGSERLGSDNAQPLVFETNNSEAMRIDAFGNLGIGTAAPTVALSVAGPVAVDFAGANIGDIDNSLVFGQGFSGEGIGSKRNAGTGQFGLDFYTASANRMHISNTGSVGIGTLSPTERLHVNGNTFFQNDIRFAQELNHLIKVADRTGASETGNALSIIGSNGGSGGFGVSGGSVTIQGGDAYNIGGSGTGGNVFITGGGNYGSTDNPGSIVMSTRIGTITNERMRILGNGNVGIGTSLPGALLDVVGAANGIRVNAWLSAGSSVCGLGYVGSNLYRNNSDNVWRFTNSNGTIGGTAINFNDCSGTPNQISFVRALGPSTANALATVVESMRIDQNGRVGIGTTAPQAPLDVAFTQNIFLSPTGSTFFNSFNGGTLSCCGNPTPSVAVRATGAFLSIGTGEGAGYYVQSDERIKRMVGLSDSRNDLSTLMKVKITDYRYTDSLSAGNIQVKGVFAQQVEEVYPQAVSKQTNFIPNIYALAIELAYDESMQTLKVTMNKPHELVVGDKVKLISKTSGEKPATVTAVAGNSFTVNGWTKQSDKVFVYGKEVQDFRIVDYDRLFTLNLSATQELVKMLDEQKKVIDELKAKEEGNRKRIEGLEAGLNKLAEEASELAALKSEMSRIKAALGLEAEVLNSHKSVPEKK